MLPHPHYHCLRPALSPSETVVAPDAKTGLGSGLRLWFWLKRWPLTVAPLCVQSREEAVIECALQFSDEENVPTVAKRPKIPVRPRRRAVGARDRGEATGTAERGREGAVRFTTAGCALAHTRIDTHTRIYTPSCEALTLLYSARHRL